MNWPVVQPRLLTAVELDCWYLQHSQKNWVITTVFNQFHSCVLRLAFTNLRRKM